ncbi:MAG TPA: aldo/keto reductase [Planctomycetota bacterium]|nr:aldo/keto reductase [Planctomycetota bacterium]
MRKRRLGTTNLELTTIGFGSWAAGGPDWKAGWGPQDDNDSIAAIRRALDCGVNWIDTAAVYGLGHSEEVVGRAIKGVRDKVIIATKCGRRQSADNQLYGDLRPEFIREECENSLRRLQIDCIDLYQIHWPEPDELVESAWTEIGKLVKAGKVRYAGVSNFSVAQMKRAQPVLPITSSQPPYNMLRREVEAEHLPFCKANNISVLVYSPMQHGLLTGAFTRERLAALPANDFRKNHKAFTEPAISKTLAIVDKLKAIAAKNNLTCSQLALAWVLRREEVTSAIVGVRKPAQIEETARAGDVVLSAETVSEIETILNG